MLQGLNIIGKSNLCRCFQLKTYFDKEARKMDFIKKSMLAGIGLAVLTKEKAEKTVDELIKKGELTKKEGKETIKEFTEKSKEFKEDLTKKVEKTVADTIERLNIPTRKELAALKSKIEKMEKSLKTKE